MMYGQDLYTTGLQELLQRKDVDAVIGHWRPLAQPILMLKAGKHVYCEKPMVHLVKQGHAVINAQKESGKVLRWAVRGSAA
jgi:predicted dehydrogenase